MQMAEIENCAQSKTWLTNELYLLPDFRFSAIPPRVNWRAGNQDDNKIRTSNPIATRMINVGANNILKRRSESSNCITYGKQNVKHTDSDQQREQAEEYGFQHNLWLPIDVYVRRKLSAHWFHAHDC